MNNIYLIGNLTKDPEKIEKDGKVKTFFTLAVDRKYTDQAGNKVTSFYTVWTYGKLAENCAAYLAKGSKAAVTGEHFASLYEKRDGGTGLSNNVYADTVEFLTKKEEKKTDDFSDINMPDLPWEA